MPEDNEVDKILNEIKQKEAEKAKEESHESDIKDETHTDEEAINIVEEESAETADEDKKAVQEKEADDSEEFELAEDKLTSENGGIDINEFYSEPEENSGSGKKKTAIIVLIVVIIAAIIAAGVFVFIKNNEKEPETTAAPPTTAATTAAPVVYSNPLTNEEGFSQSAIDKRPVAIVVENAAAARPQWGMDDENNAPDIIIEGEVEGGETRMLWMFADYNAVPEQVGPVRSARPPFIRFSQLFDSIFIHWGQSASKGNYVGADQVFKSENVDHINQMAFSDKVGLYGRDKSRKVSSEHTGVLYGANLPAAIEQEKFRTDVEKDSFSTFSFNDENTAVGTDACNTLSVTFSSRSQKKNWTYSAEDKLYHTDDYKNDVTRTNLLVLYDNTEYIVKDNYKNGKSETYCDYKLAGGSGKLASMGTVTEITWSVENGVLVIKDSTGKEVNLNTGKTWIGWASSNNGGNDVIA